jgi:iron(III) transport system substrate-binding protein
MLALASLGLLAFAPAHAQGTVSALCSTDQAWCELAALEFQKATGIRVLQTRKPTGEALAQLRAEAANPKTDIWWGGTGDPFLQAAEAGLLQPYRPDYINDLHAWAVRQYAMSQNMVGGFYTSAIGFGWNTELLRKKKLPEPKCWSDMVKPVYKGEIEISHPASSGTAYTILAGLVQLMGEDKAFDYMKKLHRNISQYTRSGTAPIKAVARGETSVSISFVHDGPGEKMQGFPVETITPSDGTGAEIGSMSLIKGARNLEAAKKFYEWALTASAQEMGAAAKQFQLPSNKAAKVDPRVPDFKKIKFIDYDYAKYGSSAERRRLIARWEREVNSLPR